MTHDRWNAVDDYYTQALHLEDDALAAATRASVDGGLPPIAVSPPLGGLLNLLARIHGARSILEIGTLGGYSAICLARALPPGGRLISLELEPKNAAIARANLEHAGLSAVAEVRVGPAIESLPRLAAEGLGPFDLFFIDADKQRNADYFAWALKLSRPGSVIVVDNVVRDGRVVDASSDDVNVQGVRRLVQLVAAEPRVDATALQTVGCKGYDGFLVAIVKR